MKYAINILTNNSYGGIQQVAKIITASLSEINMESETIALSELSTNNKISKLIKWIKIQKKISKELKIKRPDLIITHNPTSNLLVPINFYSKLVYVVHGPGCYQGQSIINKLKLNTLRLLSFIICKKIVCVSEGLKSEIPNAFKSKTLVIHNGPSIDFYINESNKPNLNYLKHYNGIKVIHFGRLCFQKNQEFSIKVAKELNSRGEKIQLTLIGTGQDYQKLIKLCEVLELKVCTYNDIPTEDYDVIFIRPQKGLYWISEFFDAAIFPSRYEGLNISIIESITTGIQVISSNCNYGPQEIQNELKKILPIDEVENRLLLITNNKWGESAINKWANSIIKIKNTPLNQSRNIMEFMSLDKMKENWKNFASNFIHN